MYVGIKQTRNNARNKQELFGVLACPMCEMEINTICLFPSMSESSNLLFIMVICEYLSVSITE